MGIMHCKEDKLSSTHGWDRGAEEGGFLSLSPEEFALEDSHIRHVVVGTELQLARVARRSGKGQMGNQDVVLPAVRGSCSACGTTVSHTLLFCYKQAWRHLL